MPVTGFVAQHWRAFNESGSHVGEGLRPQLGEAELRRLFENAFHAGVGRERLALDDAKRRQLAVLVAVAVERRGVLTCCAASIAINVLQGRRIVSLQNELESFTVHGELSVGALVPPLEVVNAMGATPKIAFESSSAPTVLYVFQPSCIWCQHNSGAIRNLTEKIRGKYRVIAISLTADGVFDFAQKYQMDFPIYSGVQPSTATLQ